MHKVRKCVWRGFVVAWAAATAAAAPIAADQPASRVVAVGGDLTEIVYALGVGDLLVGADTTSTWPAAANDLAKVGYMRQLSPEGVLSLAPDLILASADAGPPTAIDRLRQAGVDVRIAPDETTVAGVVDKIRFVGDALNATQAANELVVRFEADIASVEAAIGSLPARPSVLFLISTASGAPVAAGRDTSAEAIIAMAGGRNAFDGFEGYKPVGAEAVIAAAPDVILLPTHVVDAAGGINAIVAAPELAATPAVRDGNIIVMDGLLLLGFGPRTAQAAIQLAQELHPSHATDLAETFDDVTE